jgi:transcriptional regulator GlxA family with amidase domain
MSALGRSREQSLRIFARHQGFSPGAWVVRCRIDTARHLLRTGSDPIHVVAAAVGYDDPAHFSKLFRRHVGSSPQAWRSAPWEEDAGNAGSSP